MQTTERRLIFINRFYRPDHSATSQILSDLVERLAASGQRVTVITSRQLYELATANLPTTENLAGVHVARLWSTRFGRTSLSGRALDYATFLTSVTAWLLVRAGRDDVLVAKTDPPMLGVCAALVGSLRGIKVVHWLQDVFPEVAFAGLLGAPSSLRRLLLSTRNWALRRA